MASFKPEPAPAKSADIDDDHSRFVELAASLLQWPARNAVARQALDRAAGELMALAEQAPRRAGEAGPALAAKQPEPSLSR